MTSSTPKKIVFIDSLALAYKAHFAFITRPLKTKSGFPTSAIFGFVTQLLKIIEDLKPDFVIAAFDHQDKTFRHTSFAEYKANRQEMPEDLKLQIPKLREIVNALGFPARVLSGYEADDIIGTLAGLAHQAGVVSYMVTPDKDYMQLVRDDVFLVKPGKSADALDIFDIEKVKSEYGFTPAFMVDYLALIGDASDNVPGVKGIGPKAAVPLIQKYGSVEHIYEHIDEIESKSVQKKLIDGKELAFLSKELVTIHTEVPLPDEDKIFPEPAPDVELIRKLFLEFELTAPFQRAQRVIERWQVRAVKTTKEILNGESSKSNLITKETKAAEESIAPVVSLEIPSSFARSKSAYKLLTAKDECIELEKKLSLYGEFVFDTETDGLDMNELHLAGASFCTEEGEAYFIAVNSYNHGVDLFAPDLSDRLPVEDFVEVFKPIFENPDIKKICQNGKFDIGVLQRYGIAVKGFRFDTMVAGYIIDADQKVNMDDLSEKYLNYRPIPLSELLGTKKDAKKIFEVELKRLSDYAAEDAEITYLLYKKLSAIIEEQKLQRVAYQIDFPLIEVLGTMERTGVKIDTASLKVLSKDLEIQMEIISQAIYRMAGETFNINSNQQMQKILYDKLKLKTGKKTKTGFSTNAQSLESLRGEHEIIETLLAYRQAAKLKSTYVDALPLLISRETGRLHTTYNQTVASTGRLSSNNPNLQNIPIRSEQGKEIRKAFIPTDKNHLILSADYSQIELRIMASMSGDDGMMEAFAKGEDIHRSTASLVFMTPLADVTPDMRRKAKEVNFGILYGIGPFGLKTRLGITMQHAKETIETYFTAFKKIKSFIDECTAFGREHGYAETLFGRRRYLHNIKSANFNVRQFEERVAVNMPIQGTAADMIKIAMINIQRVMEKEKMRGKMVLQVHDELVFDVYKEELNEMQSLVKELMEGALPLNVPVLVQIGVGENWLDAH